MKRNIVSLQELAKFMRNVAYADNLKHGISWSLSVIHPSTDDGVIGFSGGLWHRDKFPPDKNRVSVNFSYDEKNGIYHFGYWLGDAKIDSNSKPTFDEFCEVVIKAFGVKRLYGEMYE